MKNSFAVIAGGAIGASLRGGIGTVLNGSPIATFIVNIVGSILLGFFYQFVSMNPRLSDSVKKFIATGLLGSFTTFSTYSLDLFVYIRDGHFWGLALYGGGSILAGILSVIIGVSLAKKVGRD
ncbi:fluoride efflux transporter FluC [Bacillus sp. es.036]|uniref:fluoride efflux transporter FluC n=1 Tax=Bacillus sp. es.036 TaxID=1761764 RepID=UPI000C006DFA|nr:CrcB family protein [Bacillus sp. es.036]PFG14232.1 CrcB protein [Bacillus sp. es.036]